MIRSLVLTSLLVLAAGCAATDSSTRSPKPAFSPPAGMSAIRMESGRGSVPLLGDSMWIDTIDGKDRRKFDRGEDGFYLVPAGRHEVGLGWASSYLSSFAFVSFEMKPGRSYLAYAKHVPRAIEFWIVDSQTGELVEPKQLAMIANKPPIIR